VIVVVPTHDRWHEARVSLAALLKSDYRNLHVLLVEDGCADGTAEKCRAEFPDVAIIHGDGNLWWSGAINLGTKQALAEGADLVMWINDDVRVEPDTISHLVESWKRNGERSVVCARIRLLGSEEEWRGEPPPWHPDFKTWVRPELSGADLLLKHPPGGQGVILPASSFRDVGFVDIANFPHYWADHDFHYRAMKAGYRYYLSPLAVVWNTPNPARPQAATISTFKGAFWFLFNRRSAMNMPTVRRLLKRHLAPAEYRRVFYPILFRHLAWLSYGWLTQKVWLHRLLRPLKRRLFGSTRTTENV
jgi:GT2 family glycosyltransferase